MPAKDKKMLPLNLKRIRALGFVRNREGFGYRKGFLCVRYIESDIWSVFLEYTLDMSTRRDIHLVDVSSVEELELLLRALKLDTAQ